MSNHHSGLSWAHGSLDTIRYSDVDCPIWLLQWATRLGAEPTLNPKPNRNPFLICQL